MSLEGTEFIRRFLVHILPRGFQRFRYYGLPPLAGGGHVLHHEHPGLVTIRRTVKTICGY
jgi:hypothetical protein